MRSMSHRLWIALCALVTVLVMSSSVYADTNTPSMPSAPSGAVAPTEPTAPANSVEDQAEPEDSATPQVRQAEVGGVTLQVPGGDGHVTRKRLLVVTVQNLAKGQRLLVAVHRPGHLRAADIRPVIGNDAPQELPLALVPGANAITFKVGRETKTFRVVFVPPAFRLKSFADVSSNHWAKKDIDKLAALDVFSGYLQGNNFELDRPATRGDVAAFLDRIVNAAPDEEASLPEAAGDAGNHKAAAAIRRMMAQGLMKGVGENRFDPEGQLTRAQIATLLDRALPHDVAPVDLGAFGDNANIPAWAKESVARMKARGLISGYEDGSFRPERSLTRAELAKLLSHFMEYKNRLGK